MIDDNMRHVHGYGIHGNGIIDASCGVGLRIGVWGHVAYVLSSQ